MTSLFARNERLLWRTRFSTTEMPSQFLTQYNTKIMTILSVFFEVISPKHTRACSSLKQWPRSLHGAVCRLREVSRLHGTYTPPIPQFVQLKYICSLYRCIRYVGYTQNSADAVVHTYQHLHCRLQMHVVCTLYMYTKVVHGHILRIVCTNSEYTLTPFTPPQFGTNVLHNEGGRILLILRYTNYLYHLIITKTTQTSLVLHETSVNWLARKGNSYNSVTVNYMQDVQQNFASIPQFLSEWCNSRM